MSLLQVIADFFESIFNKNSPEVQKKLQMKKLEKEITAYQPVIFKNGKLLPNFAEAIRILYINAKPIDDLISSTIGTTDVARNRRFEAQLVLTGFSAESQKIVESLSYEERKNQFENTAMTTSQIFDHQQRAMERIVHELSGEAFRRIDKELNTLNQLGDLCKFNFVTILQIFDPNFISVDLNYQPSYQEISVDRLTTVLEDLYYVIAGLNLTVSTLNAVMALSALKTGESNSDEKAERLKENVKKVAYILKHILSEEKLKLLICYAKSDVNYVPNKSKYENSAKKHFSEMIQARFKSDEQRIKTEMKDEKINDEIVNLFGAVPLLELKGYNSTANKKLVDNGQLSFIWLMPMRILKTFMSVYITDPIKALLNNIVIEGFFNNSQYKTDFAADVYAALECFDDVKNFEESFAHGKPNDIAIIEGYITDGHNDPDFYKRLEQSVSNINAQASKIISREINSLNKLSKHIESLIQDAKKPSSEIISNLKVLMFSSRNKDSTDLIEQQFPKWDLFFEIMKNYAIISA